MGANDSLRSRISRRYSGQYQNGSVKPLEKRFIVELHPTTNNGDMIRHFIPFALTVAENNGKHNGSFLSKAKAIRELHIVTESGLLNIGELNRLALSEKKRTHVRGKELKESVSRMIRLVSRKLIGYAFPGDEEVSIKEWKGETARTVFVSSL